MVEVIIDPFTGLIPLMLIGAAFALPVLSLAIKSMRFYEAYATAFSLIAAWLSWFSFIRLLSGNAVALYPFGGWPPPVGIVYEVDQFSGLLGALSSTIMFFITLYSSWYIKESEGCVWYYALLLGLNGGIMGCLYTGDVFNLFVMIEVLSISAYGLVAYFRSRVLSLEASAKYAFIGAVATTMYFVSLIVVYGAYGSLNMADVALKARTYGAVSLWGSGVMAAFTHSRYALAVSSVVATVLALWAFTYKAALFPNHFWLPDAHPEAPTPVSAALSGLVVSVGVYATIRWLYTLFGPSSVLAASFIDGVRVRDVIMWILMILGALSSLLGSLMMIAQKDVKRLLAYSTISHVGLMFMGLSVGLSEVPEWVRILALVATTYHLINHAVGKSLLFLSSGVLIRATGTRDMTRWGGAGKRFPATTATLVTGALNLLGVPPLGGFFSKLLLFQAFLLSKEFWLAGILIVESILSLVGYIRLINASVYGEARGVKGVPKVGVVNAVLLLLGISCFMLGILFLSGHLMPYLHRVVGASLSVEGSKAYISAAKELVRMLMTPH